MKRKTQMTEGEFKMFFNDVIGAVKGTKGPNTTIMDVLKTNGLEPDLPDAVANKLRPMLNAKAGEVTRLDHNCSWCSTCGMCGACGEVNAASLGALSASAVHIID